MNSDLATVNYHKNWNYYKKKTAWSELGEKDEIKGKQNFDFYINTLIKKANHKISHTCKSLQSHELEQKMQ